MESEHVDEDVGKTVNSYPRETHTEEKAVAVNHIQEDEVLHKPNMKNERMYVTSIYEINDIIDKAKFEGGSLQNMLKNGQVVYLKHTKRKPVAPVAKDTSNVLKSKNDILKGEGYQNFGFTPEKSFSFCGDDNLDTSTCKKIESSIVKSKDEQSITGSVDPTSVDTSSRSEREPHSVQTVHITTVSETIPMYGSDVISAVKMNGMSQTDNTKRSLDHQTYSPEVVLESTRL